MLNQRAVFQNKGAFIIISNTLITQSSPSTAIQYFIEIFMYLLNEEKKGTKKLMKNIMKLYNNSNNNRFFFEIIFLYFEVYGM